MSHYLATEIVLNGIEPVKDAVDNVETLPSSLRERFIALIQQASNYHLN